MIIQKEAGSAAGLEAGRYNARMPKVRLDILLVERGLAVSRAQAQALVMAGQVRVNGEQELKAGTGIHPDARLDVDQPPRFVSRGGEKLDSALTAFELDVAGLVCADVGASTGGFTDCLLQRGAARVYALDVGKGILHWKLRNDPRVVVMEGTNARFVDRLAEPVTLVTIDASFISLRLLLPVVKLTPDPTTAVGMVALIKPQFEAGRQDVRRGKGVIRDPQVHKQVLMDVLTSAQGKGLSVRGLMRSPLLGPKGNTEFLAWLAPAAAGAVAVDLLVSRVLSESRPANT
jgi:23S rRNA (cytidine1920-2'-O)/16S rRNA (cytidine1409-2'-O)-methyltransferase